ncbi:MAG: T9SS type A sorting domain-containing protein [Bacteroidota bacterium]
MTLALLPSAAWAQVTVQNDITSDVTWTANNEYILDGLVFVDRGATLTIEAGTVIKALEASSISTGEGASALIVRRGAQINAQGTASNPIVFTSEFDDLTIDDDMISEGIVDRGLWGGLIILGEAPTNNIETLTQIEGIPGELEAQYGGSNPADNSGTLRYISIRHGGFSISGIEGDEINGLTMGGVGSGTTIEYIEVYANLDDCYEWFGGTVDSRYLVGALCGDDTFDYDQGYQGRGQFWFSIQGADIAGRGGEHDGCSGSRGVCDDTAFSQAIVSNATYIGSGVDAEPSNDDGNSPALRLRENVGAKYFNSVFTDFANRAVRIDDGDTTPDAVARFQAGDLELSNNIFGAFDAGTTWNDIVRVTDAVKADVVATFSSTNDLINGDALLGGIGRDLGTAELDPRPMGGTAARNSSDFSFDELDDWFASVSFRGAFGDDNWARGWTALSDLGYFGDFVTTDVERVDDELPTSISLKQNYPNPFNPTTMIEFELDRAQDVRLAIYDVMGREVAVLVEGTQAAGTYRTQFDARNLASGTYFYSLRTPQGTISKTMLLMK